MRQINLQFLAILVLLVTGLESVNCQIPQDYPFKTYLDTDDNLYITGFDRNFDIETTKFPPNGFHYDWKRNYQNPGLDRGMDLVLDGEQNVYVCGYLNSVNGYSDIAILKHEPAFGNIIFAQKLTFAKEDISFGIAREGAYLYVAGFKTTRNFKDFFISKFNLEGDTIWTRTFNNSEYNGDDVATDILVDRNFVYAIGYTYNGEAFRNDVMLYTCDLNGENSRTEIVKRKYTNETPTAFIFARIHDAPPVQKSRTAVTLVTDLPFGQGGNNFLTYCFKEDNTGSLHWVREFTGGGSSVSVPTAIAADPQGNIYVTGYTDINAGNGYDFVTMKYNKDDGSYGWSSPSVFFYDSLRGNDKASSIKVKNGRVYIAGTSDSTLNGYYLAVYNQVQGYPVRDFDNVFIPSFMRNESVSSNKNKAAVVELDSSGNVYLIAQLWNENEAYYAVRKYDSEGSVIHTIDPFESMFRETEEDSAAPQFSVAGQAKFLRNYPNPFNPVTVISYSLTTASNIGLDVYDVSGKLAANLLREYQQPGDYMITFDARELPSGVYYAVLRTGNSVDKKRMVLLK